MKLRILFDAAVDTEEHCKQIFDAIKTKSAWFSPISDKEPVRFVVVKCRHDEDPIMPCKIWFEQQNNTVIIRDGEPI